MKNRAAFEQRIFTVTPVQRFGLSDQIIDKIGLASVGRSSAGIAPAWPLRLEGAPIESDQARTIAVYPAGPGQMQMWFLQHYLLESPVYNIPMAFHLLGPLNVPRIEAAFRSVIERHGTLRTTFLMEEGRLTQRVASSSAFQLQQINLEATPAHERQAATHRCVEDLACRPFDLVTEPQIRAQLVRLKSDEHVLVVTVHHIISDGWSQANLCNELSAFYTNGSAEKPAPLQVQFTDYSAWLEKRLRDFELEEQSAYWKKKLGGNFEPLDLPTDRPRASVSSFRGDCRSLRLNPDLLSALTAQAHAEGATLFMILLAAFKVLLHRYTAQEDIRVGIPFANRQRVETEGLIGFFVKTLVMRTALSDDLTFREVLERVKATAIEGYSHSDLPFEQMVEILADRADADRPPPVQTLFTLQNFPEFGLSLPGLEVKPWPVSTRTSKVDLSLLVECAPEGWMAHVEYSTDLFDADRVERMLGHWLVVLESVVENPSQRVSEIPLLSAAERHRLLVEWNRTARDYPRDKCVHQLFEEQVRSTPDAEAVIAREESLTYRELNEKADRLAGQLRVEGVGPGVLVGLSVERSLDMIIGVLGILKAGGAYWAVEENLPDERIRVLLSDARPRVLLVRKAAMDRLARLSAQTFNGDSAFNGTVAAIEDLLAKPPASLDLISSSVRAGDPAYVSYTSGSTGRPKGVTVPHRGIVRLVKNADYVSLNAEETLLHMAPLSFDASTFELWGALLNGGRVVLMPSGQSSLGEIGRAISQHGVTTLWLTAGLFHLMVEQRLNDLKPLRQLLAGGDLLSPEHVRKARRALPACRIINGYGPTENTTFTCCYTVADAHEFAARVPIGRPISNTQVYVLDRSLQPVPVGVAGELYVGGDGLAIGYLNQPQLTAERFISNPFASRPDARLYRTGDRVRWRPDGNLEFLGRLDSEVKIRGYRVDLTEIEALLRDCAGIREAVVVRRKHPSAAQTLVAYIVLDGDADLPTKGVRDHLRNSLPDYMVPSVLVVIDRLPLSPNGKIDYRSLPAPPSESAPRGEGQPLNLLEAELTRLWQRLFQRKNISRHDNFFALGGHSLLAVRLTAEIDSLFGCKLPIAALFQSPTIESLSWRIKEEDCAPGWSSLVPLQTSGSKPPLFFAHGWGGDTFAFVALAQLLGPDQPSYGLQAVGLDGKTPRHVTVEEMASHYVQEIRSFQPEGPYYLAGYSMGGVIAFEIAQQLYRLGQQVAFLALMDTGAGSMPWTVYVRTLAPFLRQRCQFHLALWMRIHTRDRFNYLLKCWNGLCGLMARNRRPRPVITAPPETAAQTPQIPGFDDYYCAVASAYRLRRYPGAIAVFLSDSSDPGSATFWGHLARGGATVHRVPGTHLEIMGIMGFNHRPALAHALQAALERAQ